MIFNSLGYKSDLIFTNFDGHIEVRKDYAVIKTLTNPNFFWGNLLIFNRPPNLEDYEKWVTLFKKEFQDPRIYHITLAWDSPIHGFGDVSEFKKNGFELSANAILSAHSAQSITKPPKFNNQLKVHKIETDEEWEQIVNLQVISAHDYLPREEWIKFYTSESKRYRAMSKAGIGNWFGGYLNGKLVTGLGVFHKEGLGRFQLVCTDPHHRRQGLCGTLVYLTALYAFENFCLNALVMCADPDYYAIKIYESIGFQKKQINYGVYWWDKNR